MTLILIIFFFILIIMHFSSNITLDMSAPNLGLDMYLMFHLGLIIAFSIFFFTWLLKLLFKPHI
jgi:hypothetical protein